MRVTLRGINSKTKRLADGSTRTYYWAWKGGPSLPGVPGSPEFIAAYNAAVARKVQPPEGVLYSLLAAFQASAEFNYNIAERTRADYIKNIKLIERQFSDFPLAALADPKARAEFLGWRDRLAVRSRRQADYAFGTLARVLSWSLNRGLITVNPCAKVGGRLYRGTRVDRVWLDENIAAFLQHAPKHLHLAMLLALWTGQRQGDLLRLPWSAYDGSVIKLRQGKNGMPIPVTVAAPLKAVLDATPKRSTIMLVNLDGKPWSEDGFRVSWRKACVKAGITGLTFHDLRGTAVLRFARAGATEAEIYSITGHKLSDVRAIMERHYLPRDPALGRDAVRKLEKYETGSKAPDCAPDRSKV